MASEPYDEAVSHLNAIRGLADSIANHYAKAGKQSKDAAYCILEEVEYLAKEINRLAGRGAVLDAAPAQQEVRLKDGDLLMGAAVELRGYAMGERENRSKYLNRLADACEAAGTIALRALASTGGESANG